MLTVHWLYLNMYTENVDVKHCALLRNKIKILAVHGIMNTSGLLQSK